MDKVRRNFYHFLHFHRDEKVGVVMKRWENRRKRREQVNDFSIEDLFLSRTECRKKKRKLKEEQNLEIVSDAAQRKEDADEETTQDDDDNVTAAGNGPTKCAVCGRFYSYNRHDMHYRSAKHIKAAAVRALFCQHQCMSRGAKFAPTCNPPKVADVLPDARLVATTVAPDGTKICCKCGARRTVFAPAAVNDDGGGKEEEEEEEEDDAAEDQDSEETE
jgi:hypothetical protein